MWLIMRTSSSSPSTKPNVERFATSPAGEPPDTSQLPPADAARALADWNYDRQNWTHAIEHYQEAIAKGADNPDVRTDLGNCFRFLGQYEKALEQYEIAQRKTRSTRTACLIRSVSLPISYMTKSAHNPPRVISSAASPKARVCNLPGK